MGGVIRCECGWELHAENSEELVSAMERHVAEQHPDVAAPPSRADVLAMAEEA
jgi:hypothetical protein